jgi:hypothetical protein
LAPCYNYILDVSYLLQLHTDILDIGVHNNYIPYIDHFGFSTMVAAGATLILHKADVPLTDTLKLIKGVRANSAKLIYL